MFEDGGSGDPGLGDVPDHAHADSGTDTDTVIGLADDVLAAARALAVGVAGLEGGRGRERVLGRLRELEGVVAAVRGTLLLAERAGEAWRRPGVPTFEAALATRSRSAPAAARREVRQADALAALPAVADAVRAGTVPVGHLDVVARVVAEASPHVNGLLTSPRGQAALVGMACEQDQPTFSRTLAQWVAAQDPGSHEADHQAQRRERFLHLSDQADGTHVRARLDRVTGHALRLALEAVGEAPGADRSPEQARADALGALAQKVLALPETGSGAAVRPHVSLLVSEETWVGLRALGGMSGGDGATVGDNEPAARSGALAGPTAMEPATLEDGYPVPMSEALRILCDCELTRVVLGADSLPIDLGRTQRLYTGVQRRAIIARDRECIWPTCAKPARWCEIHHIRWWERDGGATSLENGALVCGFHHHEIHRLDLSIERVGGTPGRRPRVGQADRAHSYVFRRPDGTVLAQSAAPAAELPPGSTTLTSHLVGPVVDRSVPLWEPVDRPPGRPLHPHASGPPGRETASVGQIGRIQVRRPDPAPPSGVVGG